MSNRAFDWLAQADHDLGHARHALEDTDYDWACFAARQAAEKAVKAIFLHLGGEGWGHSITRLLKSYAAWLSACRHGTTKSWRSIFLAPLRPGRPRRVAMPIFWSSWSAMTTFSANV